MENLEQSIVREIGLFFGMPSLRIFKRTKIKEDLGAGEVDFKELIWMIEEKYCVTIEHQDLEDVGKIISAIERSRINYHYEE